MDMCIQAVMRVWRMPRTFARMMWHDVRDSQQPILLKHRHDRAVRHCKHLGGKYLARVALGHDPADDTGDIWQLRGHGIGFVRGEQDRDPIGIQACQQAPYIVPRLDINADGRLIQQQHLRPRYQRPRQTDALLLALRTWREYGAGRGERCPTVRVCRALPAGRPVMVRATDLSSAFGP